MKRQPNRNRDNSTEAKPLRSVISRSASALAELSFPVLLTLENPDYFIRLLGTSRLQNSTPLSRYEPALQETHAAWDTRPAPGQDSIILAIYTELPCGDDTTIAGKLASTLS